MIAIVTAMDLNDLIGKDNKLPWSLPNDLSHFRKLTWGKNIVMGRKTFESIGILPNRNSIVVTRNPSAVKQPVQKITDPKQILGWEGDFYIIGGSEIYEEYLPYADVMYITQIDESFEGDAYFPKWNWKEWELQDQVSHLKSEGHNYDHTFYKYVRRN